MRYLRFAAAGLILLAGCQPEQDTQAETQQVEQVVQDLFNALAAFDYEGVEAVCTDDFLLLEHGLFWTADSRINAMKSFEGQAQIAYRLEDFRTDIEGPTAGTSYKNEADGTMGDQQIHFKWAESAVFRKEGGQWKMVLLHSTRIEPKEM